MHTARGISHARRSFLRKATTGIGAIALQALLARDLASQAPRLPATESGSDRVTPQHHAARAKRVIFLYMAGGPSHLETFDYKPKLAAAHGQPIPASITQGLPLSPLNRAPNLCVAAQTPFRNCGHSVQVISTVFPHLAP